MEKLFTPFMLISSSQIVSVHRSRLVIVIFIFIYGMSFIPLVAQPTLEWDRTIGGNSVDDLKSIQQTSDGGYILGGTSYSDATGDKSEDSKGAYDFWIVKLNAAGSKEWDKTIGGNGNDILADIRQTIDGGYIVGGNSYSDANGDKSEDSKGLDDFWVVKLNSSGVKEWDKTIGGTGVEDLNSIRQTSEGGFILGGTSNSDVSGDKGENSKGLEDYWVVKLNSTGNKVWDKTFGGSSFDALNTVQQTTDGGYILGGVTFEADVKGDKSDYSKGAYDFWLVKLSAGGSKEWDKTIGGNGNDVLYSVQQTTDGGYILGGNSDSNAGLDKTNDSKGLGDFWLVKLNTSSSKEWDQTLGGERDEYMASVRQTLDGGYIIGGNTQSEAGDLSESSKGGNDYWVVKINESGSKDWDKTIGGDNIDYLFSIGTTTDGGYILGGSSVSGAGGDKSEENEFGGYSDYWVVKLKGDAPRNCNLTLTTEVMQAEPWYGRWGAFNGSGTIDLKVTGGAAPYTYSWNAGITTQDIGLASPGFYSVVVTDANGCTGRTTTFVGVKNDFLRLLSAHTNVSKARGNDGSIDLTVIGGVVPATYQWSNGATTEDLTGLEAGTYQVTVTDAFGQKTTTTVVISEPGTPLTLSFTLQNASAGDRPDGAVDLTVNGGVGPYTYRWNTGAKTEDLPSALPGNYSVTVTDAMGASASTSVLVEIGQTPMLMDNQPAYNDDLGVIAIGLTVYPNPAVTQVTISFSLVSSGKYSLELFDIRGAKVKTIATGQAQNYKLLKEEVNLTEFANGVYLLKLVNDKEVFAKRLMIQR